LRRGGVLAVRAPAVDRILGALSAAGEKPRVIGDVVRS